jgi:uncharacterized membrane protein (UPF0136 family)
MAIAKSFDLYIALPLVGLACACILTVVGWKMNATGANWTLIVAWLFLVASAFRLIYGRIPLIPAILWTMLVGAVFGLFLYYFLWTIGKADEKHSISTLTSSDAPVPTPTPMPSIINNSGNIANVQNSPNSTVNQSIINPTQQPGLRFLNTQYYNIDGGKVLTTYKIGSEIAAQGFQRFMVTMHFKRPYEQVTSRFELLNPQMNMNGGMVQQPSDKNTYILSVGGLSQSYLWLDFTAPYKMEEIPVPPNP